jgi:hypothetical protein
MSVVRRIVLFLATVGLLATVVAPAASAHDRRGPVVSPLASFGDGSFTTSSTIGPDGALYVTDGSAGSVSRIDRRSGRVTTYATGLPQKAFPTDIGGPVDVVFVGRTAYVLVTLVSGNAAGTPFGDPDDKNGIYRLERNGDFTLVADLGRWSADHPPEPAFFVDTGVHYAVERYRGGLLVTDGHHNRVLWVSRSGAIREVATFGNIVPTGLEVARGRVLMAQMGPIPHEPGGRQGARSAAGVRRRARQWGCHARRCRARAPRPAVRPVAGSVGRGGRGIAGPPEHRPTGCRPTRRKPGAGRGPARTRARARPADVDGDRRTHGLRGVGRRPRLQGQQPLADGLHIAPGHRTS